MNIHKHMEAIFVVTLAVVSTGTLALESLSSGDAEQSVAVARENAVSQARAIVVRAPTLPQRA
jgi:hypothetical protein